MARWSILPALRFSQRAIWSKAPKHDAPMKRGVDGIYHKMSPKHLQRYIDEFQHLHNSRPKDTIDQMGGVVCGMVGRGLPCKVLIADNGLSSGARS